MIEIRNLTKRFGTLTAVDDLSFRVSPGEVLGFLGPNGAGKSTTMKMVTGFLPPTSGTATVCGHDILAAPADAKAAIGYLPEGAPLYPDMTPRQMLRFVGEARGMGGARLAERMETVTELVELGHVMNQRIETLSKGFKRRVGLALAILHDPEVLVLDEPTDGLDPNQKHQVRDLIRSMAAGKVIVLSTHILEEVEAVCTRAIIVSEGQLRFDGTPRELRERSRFAGAVEVTVPKEHADAASASLGAMDAAAGIELIEATGEEARITVFPGEHAKGALLVAVQEAAAASSWSLSSISVDRGRMDDVFRTVTTASAGA
ncbi:MAG: ABC transporter ATP-binding protein [Planctomycetota bacterium]|nr:ABC transporter ATP-binding protein [Planctomycetota bacterium]MEC8510607.1 ABC transporter ATP-binding protein [Planctomycetota bacterium]MEE2940078.1 ABC transporter ATP-binding protein [Planctomycetota bacterium]